jgi:hypothetical protein
MITIDITHSNHSDEVYVWIVESDSNGLPAYYLTQGPDGRNSRVKITERGAEGTPWLRINRREFSVLMPSFMDKLIEFGIKPKEHSISDREWSAQRSHLEDMRKIVGEQLGVEL